MGRLSLRTQLTLLYAVPFLVVGGLLLGIPFAQVNSSQQVGTGAPPESVETAGPSLGLFALLLAALLVLAVVLGWLVAGHFLRPLRTIVDTARDISATNLHRRLGDTGRGELAELSRTLDDLFMRLEAAFESQRRFVANAAHELRTPLTAERTLLQVALADHHATPDTLRAACRQVVALSVTQERLIDALLTLASGEQGVERREPFDLATLAADAVTTRHAEAARRDVRVTTSLAPAPAAGDPSLVGSLVANLVDNAVRYNTPGGQVEVSTSATGAGALVRVWNTGPVVAAGEMERLFQPFQRAGRERVAGGYGLGLAIVRAIAGAHGAALHVTARPGGGLDVEVVFPA